jgi:mono/diheme cytochrome c family protein
VNLRLVANIVEALVAAAVIVFVVLLFTNDPTPPPEVHPDVVAAAGGVDGAAIFGQRCAGCHGGDGSGGIGPRLAGGRVVADFPDQQQQIAFVTNGQDGMPAFGERLSPEEIAAVVDYTRTVLANVHP